MNITRTYNNGTGPSNTSLVFSGIGNSSTGGVLNYTVPANDTGTYNVIIYLNSSKYGGYLAGNAFFLYNQSNMFSITPARTAFASSVNGAVGGWGYLLLGVIITLVSVGFASRYSQDGAGFVGLIVLWGFAAFNPGAVVVLVPALGGITVMMTVLVTTAAVVGAYLLRNQY